MKANDSLPTYEEHLAGIILHHPGVIDRELITPELFTDPGLRSIINAIFTVRETGRKPDFLLILDELTKHGKGDLSARLASLEAHSSANAGFYAEKLRLGLQGRSLKQAASKAIAELDRNESAPSQIADELMAGATTAIQLSSEPHDQSLSALLPGYAESMETRIQNRRNRTSIEITTGLRAIDVVMGPIHPGEMIIIAARPGTGKRPSPSR